MRLEEFRLDISNMKKRFQSAKPFPHLVIDNFLEEDLANKIEKDFPKPEDMSRHGSNTKVLNGWQTNPNDISYIPSPAIEALFNFLRNKDLRNLLKQLCGAKTEMLCDPEFIGSGLLVAQNGGIHKIHRDRNRHPKTNFYLRLILIIYFNQEWSSNYGGCLELWNEKITKYISIEPLFNRCVIFENTNKSYHGISQVKLPNKMVRKALNFYYYTTEIPERENNMYIHDTEFFPRPEERLQYWVDAASSNFPKNFIAALKPKLETLVTVYQRQKYFYLSPQKINQDIEQKLSDIWHLYNS